MKLIIAGIIEIIHGLVERWKFIKRDDRIYKSLLHFFQKFQTSLYIISNAIGFDSLHTFYIPDVISKEIDITID